jgi:Spy/CpxP family protein refolding chaperone
MRKRPLALALAAPLVCALLFLAVAPSSAMAQTPPPAAPDSTASPPAEGRRDAARFFLLQRMREELQLTDAQSLRVLDIMREMDGERAGHRKAMETIAARIRLILQADSTPDALFREQVGLYQVEVARFESRQRELEQRVLEALTPRQQAGFLLLKRRLLAGGGPPHDGAQGSGKGRGRGRN